MNNPFLIFALTFITVFFSLHGFWMYSNKKRDEYILKFMRNNTAIIEDTYHEECLITMPDGVVIRDDFTIRMKSEIACYEKIIVINYGLIYQSVKFNAKKHWDSNKFSMLFKFKRVSK